MKNKTHKTNQAFIELVAEGCCAKGGGSVAFSNWKWWEEKSNN